MVDALLHIPSFRRIPFRINSDSSHLLPRLEMALDLRNPLDLKKFYDLREEGKRIVEENKKQADRDIGGQRVGKAFYEAKKDFEPTRPKLVKTSDVIAAANLMAANFMVRVWPEFLKAKLEEWVIAKTANAITAKAAVGLLTSAGKKEISKVLGPVLGSFATKITQEAEMRALEKKMREGFLEIRKQLNDSALSQEKKPSRIGPVYTRNGQD